MSQTAASQRALAAPMFCVSLLYLAFLSAVVVLWVDVPMM